MTPEALTHTLQEFLSEAAGAVVLEDGAVAFDLAQAKYSISGEFNKCLLHLWSAERNAVRRVLDAEMKSGTLRLAVQRLGQARPTKLEICRDRDRRTPTAKRLARMAYEHKLRRALERHLPEFTITRLSTGADLEKSFGPIYTRGVVRRGQSGFAVLGVNEKETQASIDASLTFGILWLGDRRNSSYPVAQNATAMGQPRSLLIEGLLLFVPRGTSTLVRERIANLNHGAAKWRLFEFNERDDSVVEIDCSDRGNIDTRLVHAPNEAAALERFAESVEKIRSLLPNCEVAVLSPAEIAFRWRGLEFARARLGGISHFSQNRKEVGHPATIHSSTFLSGQEIVFGVGAEERVLDHRNWEFFADLVTAVRDARHPYGPRHNPLFRLQSERWLESLVASDVSVIDESLGLTEMRPREVGPEEPETRILYSQVPAFSAADRAMIDVLTTTRDGRLAVVELKTDEDIHLPLQGLDYWARVEWHHARGEFSRFGYFAGRELSDESPLLFLVAPALHVHPATDVLLRYLAPEIKWEFVGIDERWREGVKVVFRKRPGDRMRKEFRLPVAN